MRLIDADQLIDECEELISIEWNHNVSPASWADAEEEFLQRLKDASIVDAVEVVRCKDCKWFEPCEEIEGESWTGYCTYGEFHTDEMDFCSRGERKEKC